MFVTVITDAPTTITTMIHGNMNYNKNYSFKYQFPLEIQVKYDTSSKGFNQVKSENCDSSPSLMTQVHTWLAPARKQTLCFSHVWYVYMSQTLFSSDLYTSWSEGCRSITGYTSCGCFLFVLPPGSWAHLECSSSVAFITCCCQQFVKFTNTYWLSSGGRHRRFASLCFLGTEI